MNLRRYLGVALFAFGSLTTSAFGQSFYWNSASAQSVALGGVYVPSSSDALDAIAANPAGLTTLTRPVLNANLSTIFARGSFSNSVNTNSPMTTSPGVVPYGAFGMPIGHIAIQLWSRIHARSDCPSSDWKYVDAPGTLGVTYGLQEQKSAILAGRAAAGFGVRINKRLSIGATVGAVYNSNTLHAPYIFQSQPELMGTKTLLDLHTNGTVGIRASACCSPDEKAAGRRRVEIAHGNQQHRHGHR